MGPFYAYKETPAEIICPIYYLVCTRKTIFTDLKPHQKLQHICYDLELGKDGQKAQQVHCAHEITFNWSALERSRKPIELHSD